jgi:UDP-N-acetylmuramyl pentapeptide synthase
MDARNIVTGSKAELLGRLIRILLPGDWVLVKGSRAMAMEEIVGSLREWASR